MCHVGIKKGRRTTWISSSCNIILKNSRLILTYIGFEMGLYWPEKVPVVQLCTVYIARFIPTRVFPILKVNDNVSLFIRHILCSKYE